jgi:hypothetical protein
MDSAVQTWFGGPGRRWLGLSGLGALVVAAGFLLPLMVRERTPPTPRPADGTMTKAPDITPMLTRLALGTVFVLGLCVVTLRLGRRWLCAPTAEGNLGRQFEVLETLAVGNRCAVHLVRAGGRHLLAGVDASGLKALVALDDE